ncbi:MAG: hypothetical protein JJV99_06260 [Colwellia sp.]|nr:hypothetical protein [Colwellia sp.]
MRELIRKKVKGASHSATGFVLSQLPDFKSGQGFNCKVAWDAESLKEAESFSYKDLADEHSNDIELVTEE